MSLLKANASVAACTTCAGHCAKRAFSSHHAPGHEASGSSSMQGREIRKQAEESWNWQRWTRHQPWTKHDRNIHDCRWPQVLTAIFGCSRGLDDFQVIRNVASHSGVLEQMCELLDSEGVTISGLLDSGKSQFPKWSKELTHYVVGLSCVYLGVCCIIP